MASDYDPRFYYQPAPGTRVSHFVGVRAETPAKTSAELIRESAERIASTVEEIVNCDAKLAEIEQERVNVRLLLDKLRASLLDEYRTMNALAGQFVPAALTQGMDVSPVQGRAY